MAGRYSRARLGRTSSGSQPAMGNQNSSAQATHEPVHRSEARPTASAAQPTQSGRGTGQGPASRGTAMSTSAHPELAAPTSSPPSPTSA